MPERTRIRKGGKRKIGRDKDKCARYRAAGTREKNKERKRIKEAKRQERFRLRREGDDKISQKQGL